MENKYFGYANEAKLKLPVIKKIVREIENILNNYQSIDVLNNLKYEELCEILKHAETLCNYTRSAISIKNTSHLVLIDEEKKGTDNQEINVISEPLLLKELEEKQKCHIETLPVEVNYYDGLLTVHTPLTFKRGYKKSKYFVNYNLAYNVKTAIEIWQDEHNFSLIDAIEIPTILVMKRVDVKFNHQRIFDADNIENQRILNMISVGLNLPDNAPNMKLFSCFEVDNDEKNIGTFFYIFSEKDFEKYKYLFKTK